MVARVNKQWGEGKGGNKAHTTWVETWVIENSYNLLIRMRVAYCKGKDK